MSNETCLVLDANIIIRALMNKKNLSAEKALETLNILLNFITIVDRSLYSQFEKNARERMRTRDIDDWPILALSLVFNCPIWTEDTDFFCAGVATWTTDRIHLLFE
ncbi:hypothetical protein cce_0024 [Crocosphaera subtropica ATCC 51142]|uniref:PIN domain-containing protein n=1 Tax=Crocosphaera subtropica (strain ATCC 51142 / BH68) TaxID=43989 RepID=B1WYE6_CROS5|nr:PIN domain-containing protein [Crocosphaera subtropica]ACB49376.1 hypothetical protein cce_0024 [Crocosphaera subtropica ATCC 51142]